MEWEFSKENVMPVKAGHNLDIVNEALKAKAEGSAQSDVIEDQRRQLLQAIQGYSGEDPLEPWIRYIKWIKDAYPAGGAQSQLLKVVEECTRKFQKDERYRCDRRYLQIWIQYADCCSDPSDLFAFLEKNNIGQDHALFYEAYATSMEVRRKFAKAESIYHLGIQRSAQPLVRLENMYRNYLHRMNERFKRDRQEQLQMGSNENGSSQMRHFGNASSSSGFSDGVQTQRPQISSSISTRRPEKGSLQISADPEFASINPVQDIVMKEKQGASYEHFGSDADRKKENVQQPGKWTKAKISQNINAQSIPRPHLDVLVDEEFSASADIASDKLRIPANKNTLQGLRVRLEDMQKIKRHSPSLKGSFLSLQETWGLSTAEVSDQPISESSKLPAAVATARGPNRETIFAYNNSILCKDGHEQSFEEARLSIMLEKMSWHVSDMEVDAQAEKCEEIFFSRVPKKIADIPPAIHPSIHRETIEGPFFESNAHSCVGSVGGQEVYLSDLAKHDLPHQTVMDELESQPATERERALACSQRQPDPGDIRPLALERAVTIDVTPSNTLTTHGEETVAIKQFVEQAIVLGSDPAVPNVDAVGHQGLVEPTITTKEALADILDMFNKPLVCNNPRSKSRKLNDAKRVSSETAICSSDFEIFVDEDLGLRSPASRSKLKEQKSEGRHSVDLGGQNLFLHAAAGEHLKSSELLRGVTHVPLTSLAQATAPSEDFVIYREESIDTQPNEVSQKASKTPSDIDHLRRALGSNDGQVATLTTIDSGTDEKRRSRTTTNGINTTTDPGSFQIFVDEDFREPAEPPRRGRTKSTSAAVPTIDRSADDHPRDLLFDSEKDAGTTHGHESHDHQAQGSGARFLRPEGSLVNCSTMRPDLVTTESQSMLQNTPHDVQARGRGRRAFSKSPGTKAVRRSPRLKVDPKLASPHTEEVPTAHVYTVSNPWDGKHDQKFLLKLQRDISSYEGFEDCRRKYNGTIPLSSLKGNHVRDKVLKLGASEYHLKKCIGQGAFAQVFEAEDEDDDLLGFASNLALKFQRPACPWEFYIYRQLDIRIPSEERQNYGQVRKFYQYPDCSFMVCNQYDAGTLQDVVNAYLAKGQKMDEMLCMFYTIEMLRILETLHKIGIIHGDFKPDNLMIRDDSNEMDEWSPDRVDGWESKGLALIDFGRSIDTTLYPEGVEFRGDCKTDSFRCPEMYENRPWTFQVDTFGLCVVAHCLLYGTYMQIENHQTSNGRPQYRPKSTYKRFWQVELWRTFFETLINIDIRSTDHSVLSTLRRKFEDYLTENNLGRKLKALLAKQTIMMYRG